MRVRYLLVTVGLGLIALTALMMMTGSSATAQEGAGARGDSRPQPHSGVTCRATVDGSGTVHSDSTSKAVRDAVAAAADGDLVKVSGYCPGATTIEGIAATVYISKEITLRGGYDTGWSYDPDAYPTTLDAGHAGRVVVISDTNGVTLDSLQVVSGTTPIDEGGGGIFLGSGAAATLTHSTVYSNTGKGSGGGIRLTQGAALTVSHSTVCSNTADNGGGIRLDLQAAVTITDSTIHSNTVSYHGGGINATSGQLNLTNSTVSGNKAGYDGAGFATAFSSVKLVNCTVSANLAGRDGGGVFQSFSTVDLQDTIVADQRAGADCYGGMTSLGHNLDSDGTCDLSPAQNDIITGTADLRPLRLNAPGKTATHALGLESDALEAGSCAGGTVDEDQRGVARPLGDACDIGAYEAAVRCWATVDGSGTVHQSANSQAVRAAVADAVAGDLVKVSGYCAGVEAIEGLTVTVHISKNITVKGGYDTAWTYDPGTHPTTLDAVHAGRVAVISDTNGATLDSLRIVSGTTPVDENGGGILVAEGAAVTVSHSAVYSNSAEEGGGVYVAEGAAATVSHSTVYSNWSEEAGGGFYVDENAEATVSHSSVYSNSSEEVGGGICVARNATASVSHSTIYGNSTKDEGGGIYVWGGTLNLTHSTVNDNQGGFGGGILNERGALNLTNCTVSGNTAQYGGGIGNRDAPANLIHCTISGNTAHRSGGGISSSSYNSSPINLWDTIIADQLSGNDCAGGTTSQGYNLDSDGSCGLSVLTNDVVNGTADLGPLQVNAPGETATHALGPNSQALDAGNCANGNVDDDQRGVARPQGDACDIGAFEFEVRVYSVFLPTILKGY